MPTRNLALASAHSCSLKWAAPWSRAPCAYSSFSPSCMSSSVFSTHPMSSTSKERVASDGILGSLPAQP